MLITGEMFSVKFYYSAIKLYFCIVHKHLLVDLLAE